MSRFLVLLRRGLPFGQLPSLLVLVVGGAWLVRELAWRTLEPGDATRADLRGAVVLLGVIVQLALNPLLELRRDANDSPQLERRLRGGSVDVWLRAFALTLSCLPIAALVCLVMGGLPRAPTVQLGSVFALSGLGLLLGSLLQGAVLRASMVLAGLAALTLGAWPSEAPLGWVGVLLPPLPCEDPQLLAPLLWGTGALLLASALLAAGPALAAWRVRRGGASG